MNPMMFLQFGLPLLQRLVGSGKLEGLVPDKGLGPLKELLGEPGAVSPEQQVLAAVAVLSEHAPAGAAGGSYAQAISQVLEGLSKLKAAVASGRQGG